MEKIFRGSWLLLAHESEIATAGDYVTRRMGLDPVIVSRNDEGEIRVFLNACRHRGATLCSAMGNSGHFRCSYPRRLLSNSGPYIFRIAGAPRSFPSLVYVHPWSP